MEVEELECNNLEQNLNTCWLQIDDNYDDQMYILSKSHKLGSPCRNIDADRSVKPWGISLCYCTDTQMLSGKFK
jgi:hypothetical protein